MRAPAGSVSPRTIRGCFRGQSMVKLNSYGGSSYWRPGAPLSEPRKYFREDSQHICFND